MTVKEYLEIRNKASYGKGIRIIDIDTNKNCGTPLDNLNAIVEKTKITSKFLFVFVKTIDK